jgi:hypothetical protein
MKKIILTVAAFAILGFNAFSQAPEAVKYQAVVRDGSSLIVANQSVGVQLRILEGSASGTAVYTETFNVTTNQFGLINLEIGTGTTTDDFSTIDWGNGSYFIENAIDVSGGTTYEVMGTSQLLSVPYALHANTADNVLNDQVDDADNDPTNELQDWTTLPGIPADIADGDQVDDADSDPNNELQDWSTLPGIPAGIADGDDVDDADADPNNEIQDLDLNGNTLSLTSDATTVDLSSYLDNTDAQTLSLAGSDLSISGGNTITLPSSGGTWTEITPNTRYALTQFTVDAELTYGANDLSSMSFGGSNGVFWGSHGSESTGMFTNGNQISFVSPGDFSPNAGTSTIADFYEEDGNILAAYIDPSGQYFQVSDKSLKENINVLENSLNKILSLRGYSYDYKQCDEDMRKETPKTRGYGILAQELMQVAPELVNKTGQGHYIVNYNGIVPILIEGVKEQQTMIQDLQKENDELKSRLDAMDARLKAAGF